MSASRALRITGAYNPHTVDGVAILAEFTQKVPRNYIKLWALFGLFTKQKVPRILKKV